MRYTGSKNKLARREGIDLGMKTMGSKSQSNLLRRINVPPGQHGGSRVSKRTDYGVQLREKQKLKRIYGVTEKQMSNYFSKASRAKGNTAEILTQQLEMRLDNVVYRMGFAPTRAASRQLVNHGHFSVNNKKTSIASFQVSINDKITIKKKSIEIPYITEYMEKKDIAIPSWLNRTEKTAKVVGQPSMEIYREIINLQSVIEFYSR